MRILLAVDGSGPSRAAVRVTRGMALPPGSVIRVISVVEEPLMVGTLGAVASARLAEELRSRVEAALIEATMALAGVGQRLESVLRTGDPAREIVTEARNWRADLIVMGSHGRTGSSGLSLGSVAESVMRHAPCPVEIAQGLDQGEALHP